MGTIYHPILLDKVSTEATAGESNDRGLWDASGNLFPTTGGTGGGGAVEAGNFWTISVAGTLGGTSVTPGYTIRALVDTPGQTASNWQISPPPAGGFVTSVFGRTGAISAQSGDYTWAQINKTISSLADLTTRSASDLNTGTVAAARLPGNFSGFGNPSSLIGLSANNGAASTALRSDATPALDQGISPTWTGTHTFNQHTQIGATKIFAGGGLSVGTTTDPGAGIANANTGFRVGNAAASGNFLRGNGTNFVSSSIQSSDLPGGFTGFGNPTASVGLSAVNGSATTAMRSDAAPAISQGIAPTWTGIHIFSNDVQSTDRVWLGNLAVIGTDQGYFGPLYIQNQVTDVNVAAHTTGQTIFQTVNSSTNASGSPDTYAAWQEVITTNSTNLFGIQALRAAAGHAGTGTLQQILSINALSRVWAGSGAVTNVWAVNSVIQVDSTGSITGTGWAGRSRLLNNGTVATGVGHIIDIGGSGSYTTLYGLYITGVSAVTATNKWEIYSAGTSNSYFGGNVGVGTVSPGILFGGLSASGRILHVAHASSHAQLFLSSSGSNNVASLGFEVSDATLGRRFSTFRYNGATNAVKLMFLNEVSGAVAQDNVLVLRNDGNVGIGVSSPAHALEVAGNIFVNTATGNIYLKDTSTGWQSASTTVITPQASNSIRSTSYTSGLVGWNISALGNAEFNNVDVRGAIHASIFTYNAINATAGTQGVFKSAAKLRTDVTVPSSPTYGTTTVTIEAVDQEGLSHAASQLFVVNDVLRLKDGLVGDTWFKVSAVSDQTTFWRYTAIIMAGSNNVTYRAGMGIPDYGQSGNGFIILTADQTNSPYMQMATHGATFTSSDSNGTLTLVPRLRVGNLNGSYGYSSDIYGFGTGEYGVSGKAWVTVEQTNGIRMGSNTSTRIHLNPDGSGFLANSSISWNTTGVLTVTANASIAGWAIAASSISSGTGATTVAMDSGGTNPAFYAGSSTPASAPFRVTNAGALTATNASITGTITATSGTIGGWTINSNSITNSEVKIAAGVNFNNVAGTGEGWFGKSSTGQYGMFIKGTTAAFFQIVAGHPSIGSAGRPFFDLFDGTRRRVVIGELNTTVWDGTATNSLGMKIWDSSGNILAHFSDLENTIAGWTVSLTEFKSGSGSSTVGLSSAVTGGDDIRIYAGNATPSSAPFRVTEAGVLVATNATITGAITATSGTFSGSLSAATGTFTGDLTGSSMALTGKLTMSGSSSAITIGTTPPTSASSGTGLWIDRTGIHGLASNVLQASINATNGSIVAGGGAYILDADGLTVKTNVGSNNQIRWLDTSYWSTWYGEIAGFITSGISAQIQVGTRFPASGAPTNGLNTTVLYADHDTADGSWVKLKRYGSTHSTKASKGFVVVGAKEGMLIGTGGMSTNSEPVASAALEVQSTTGAFIPPKMTSTQRDALTATDGMVIYNTTTNKLQTRAAGSWTDLH